MAWSMSGYCYRQKMIRQPVSPVDWGKEWTKLRQLWLGKELLNRVLAYHDLAKVVECSSTVRRQKTIDVVAMRMSEGDRCN